jgi:hypothetical protein
MNRAEIRALVIEHTGRDDKVSLINSMVNVALKKVSSEHLWNDLHEEGTAVFTIGSNTVALASDLRRLAEVRVLDGLSSWKLLIRPKSFIVKMYPDITAYSNAKPRFGYREGTTLYVVPAPDVAYDLAYSYYRRQPDLADDATDIAAEITEDCVVAYVTYRVFKSVGQHEDAAQWRVDYQDLLAAAKALDRAPAVEHAAEPRGRGRPVPEDFYVNPFIKETP